MGVPALFRFLQRKYPKIILPVEEDSPDPNSLRRDPTTGDTMVDITTPNPNGVELDNLYLDMNGIVHPCTHPEGKPAPETEEDMMVEVFRYTDRVVNIVRPRKLLFMAIDGVAPRAKMNQQRSRRFRSVRDADEAARELQEAITAYEALGHTVSDDIKNKKSWDSNAITPGTPFMALLAASLRYWVAQKMNSDPGWKDLEVIISDASVPGEGEHKIMDWIRRQRVSPGYDPNTQHVIYGLDADLIMLALATHEPNFRVLREDVFADSKKAGCRSCGRPGHVAAQCTIAMKYNFDGLKNAQPAVDNTENGLTGTSLSVDKKPFIFLDVTILREYLEVALNVPNQPFPFDLEMAIDDWIFLIFFVGNDFLPHLPSLDIRKGGIETLLNIWKKEILRMDGYVTSHGHLNLARVQMILEGLGQQEAEIFKKHHEDDERQKQREAQQKLAREARNAPSTISTVPRASSSQPGPAPVSLPSLPHGLPPKPTFDMFAKPETAQPAVSPASPTASTGPAPNGVATVGETNRDVVSNRAAIRMANMSAAEALKAELHGLMPLGRNAPKAGAADKKAAIPAPAPAPAPMEAELAAQPETPEQEPPAADVAMQEEAATTPAEAVSFMEAAIASTPGTTDGSVTAETVQDTAVEVSPRGVKRKAEDLDEDAEGESMDESDEVAEDAPIVKKSKTEEHDDIKLWTPGYQERYYRSKFEFEWTDTEARKKITSSYVEGLSWVLHYYYQGVPSWTWFYPSHYAPFAGDFEDVDKLSIKFKIGQPFKPFEQLMAVFPPASRNHIPEAYHDLMLDENSPIIEFYPEDFEIDMNGKTQSWQGISLLPFIDEQRLLDAMKPRTSLLSKDEVRRNAWGSSSLLISDQHPLYNFLCELYTKRKKAGAHPIDIRLSNGLAGTVVADPAHVPGATYESPLARIGLPDIPDNRSIAVLYYFPKQVTPHRSVLLPGAQRPPRRLDRSDIEFVRAGREYNPNHRGRGGGRDNSYNNASALGRGSYSGDRNSRSDGSYGAGGYQEQSWEPRYPNSRGGGGYSGGSSYPDRNGSYGYGNRGSQGGYPGYGNNSNRPAYGSNYGSYGTPPPPGQGRGGYPSYRGAAPAYGQSRGRGAGRGGYY